MFVCVSARFSPAASLMISKTMIVHLKAIALPLAALVAAAYVTPMGPERVPCGKCSAPTNPRTLARTEAAEMSV